MTSFLSSGLLYAFLPTFFLVSITPGMCMTLALSLGITVGVRRALWMMAGELAGVAVVAVAAVVGVATVMLRYPMAFAVLRYAGGAYLLWLGIQLWRSRGRLALDLEASPGPGTGRRGLAAQGFVTAVANPKGWAFFIALLPPFIDTALPLTPQLAALVGMILTIELSALLIYATGGRALGRLLARRGGVTLLNRIAGTLMIGVGIWLALE
ncbi:LysE family translocator [Arhodomonas aquaeolei]|uniref:LysE family translocator n=1 Tax=Arhodomonas aquaeolei TaxID=2369 RepID=UPI0003A5742A|nr:LysE family translocator [Arhodomonas aquaeolei]